ncbi:DUF4411 family protein [Patescibacteria group bacterium]|nr:DUF4411 family protein [Patescibacteria group bacterium]MBU4347514.1 DUF4411 family protein [Patescibacteria group bacterium]MBU4455024.1 DUF4411 family protein [Patescibacteria group bacterium]MCG2690797.1 DUF4411 family protein [Candidatus Parcubacteria bacterium]
MFETKRKLIIDNDSLIKFFNYYFFDRDNRSVIYQNLKNFVYSKIKSGEIVIIDKVFSEFKYIDYIKDIKEIKNKIKPYIIKTEHLMVEAENLLNKYTLDYNKKFKSPAEIEIMENEALNGADLFIIALCKEYKEYENKDKIEPVVVSEETFNKKGYKKLVDKIPSICKKEGIECVRLPHSLFNIYKDELEFDLKIK